MKHLILAALFVLSYGASEDGRAAKLQLEPDECRLFAITTATLTEHRLTGQTQEEELAAYTAQVGVLDETRERDKQIYSAVSSIIQYVHSLPEEELNPPVLGQKAYDFCMSNKGNIEVK